MLQWAHEKGCPWDARTCAQIAKRGDLQMLQWAHEKGCPWDYRVCEEASRKNHFEVKNWAIDNGCEKDWDYERVFKSDRPERNPYFDDDNWRQREADNSDEARRQD